MYREGDIVRVPLARPGDALHGEHRVVDLSFGLFRGARLRLECGEWLAANLAELVRRPSSAGLGRRAFLRGAAGVAAAGVAATALPASAGAVWQVQNDPLANLARHGAGGIPYPLPRLIAEGVKVLRENAIMPRLIEPGPRTIRVVDVPMPSAIEPVQVPRFERIKGA